MAFNGNGIFNRLYSFVNDSLAGINILSSRMDNELNGIATGLSNTLTRDGQSPPTNNIPMGGFRLTDLATPTSAGDAVRKDYADGVVNYTQSGSGAVQRKLQAKVQEFVSVMDYGAKGDGVTDDAPAWQAAVNASKYVYAPPAQYKFASTINIPDGRLIKGAGKSAWEPYNNGGPFPSNSKSEIIVNGIQAINASGSNNVRICSLSIKSSGGTQSNWATPAGFQSGSIGVDITGSSQFEMDDVSFFGLETGVIANKSSTAATQMPRISNWSASDCDAVFRFGSPSSSSYTVRDCRIADCVIALHCNKIIEAHYCDGLRIEHCRFFQCKTKPVYIRSTPFVEINGLTTFETGDNAVTLDTCTYCTLSGIIIARAGGYNTTTPYPSFTAIVIPNCTDVSISGLIIQPTGKAIEISGSSNISFSGTVGTPYWTSGSPVNSSGVVNITTSVGVSINASFGGTNQWVNVYADAYSSRTLSGSFSGDSATGSVRAVKLQQCGGYINKISADTLIGVSGDVIIDTIRYFIPAGKTLRSRSVETTSPTVVLRVGSVFWLGVTAEPGGGNISIEDKVLYDNTSGPDGWYSVQIRLYNPSGSPVTVPAGHETRISMVTV